jgi:antimicrobial peptide system SdpA family protein
MAAVAAGWAAVGLVVVHVNLPPNALILPGESAYRADVVKVVPEGWAFFTKSPRDAAYVPYERAADGTWRKAELWPHSRPSNAFGLDRRSRAQGVELGILQSAVGRAGWVECYDRADTCFERAPLERAVNSSPEPSLCGDVGVAQQFPVPWVYARSGERVGRSLVGRVRVTC